MVVVSMPVMIFGTSLFSQTFASTEDRASTAEWFRNTKKDFAETCLNDQGYEKKNKERLAAKQAKRNELIKEQETEIVKRMWTEEDGTQRKATVADYIKADTERTKQGRSVCRRKIMKEEKEEEIKEK